jgi:hypothetical protein
MRSHSLPRLRTPAPILLAAGLALASSACGARQSPAEREIADRGLHFLFQGTERPLGCTVGEVISKARGHAVFEWTVDVEKPGDQEWRLRLRGLTQVERKPTSWDVSLRPSASNPGTLVAHASQSDGDELHPDQLYTFLAQYCSRRP